MWHVSNLSKQHSKEKVMMLMVGNNYMESNKITLVRWANKSLGPNIG
jgi:hypothetical protein